LLAQIRAAVVNGQEIGSVAEGGHIITGGHGIELGEGLFCGVEDSLPEV